MSLRVLFPLLAAVPLVGCGKSSPPAAATPAPAAAPQADDAAAVRKKYADRTALLHEAAEKGQVSLIADLRKQGADPNDKDDHGRTALHKAAAKGNRSAVVALLAFGADPGEKDDRGRNALHAAAEAGHAECIAVMRNPGKLSALAGEVLAAGAGEAGKVLGVNLDGAGKRLGEMVGGADNALDADGRTPIMAAAAAGHLPCLQELWVNNWSVKTERRDKSGRTALMLAAAGGHTEAADYLSGFSVSPLATVLLTDPAGKTAEQLAAAGGYADTVKAIRRGTLVSAASAGDVNQLNQLIGDAPLNDWPGPDLLAVAVSGNNLPMVRSLMARWKDRPAAEKERLLGGGSGGLTTVLHDAAYRNAVDVLKVLLDAQWWADKELLASQLRRKEVNGGLTAAEYAEKWNTGPSKDAIALLRSMQKELDEKK